MPRALRASPGFALALLVTLAAAGFNGLMVGFMALGLDFLLPGRLAEMAHFTEAHHRVHDLGFAFLFIPSVAGVLAQLRRPAKNVGGLLMALVPSLALLLTLLLTLVLANNRNVLQPPWAMVMVGVLVAAVLHPAGSDFFRSFAARRASWAMLALVVAAAVPFLSFAFANLGLQGSVPDDHAAAGHYGFMAAFGFTVIGVGALASLRSDGWRLTAWIAGLLPALLGIASMVFPEATSSLPVGWALAAVAWGAAFVGVAELASAGPESAGRPPRSGPSPP